MKNSLKRHPLRVNETIATVIAEEQFIPIAEKEVRYQRAKIEEYGRQDSFFFNSLIPLKVSNDAPEIVKKMAEASNRVGVGPMAAVAGAISHFAVKAMVKAGCKHVVFDNGGDIAMYLEEEVVVGVYAGDNCIRDLGLVLPPSQKIIGLCTSSSSVGPSFSLGKADSATVLAENAILADATATALGNSINQYDEGVLSLSLNKFGISGIDAMIGIIGDKIGLWGDVPELVRADVKWSLITKG